MVPAQRLVLQDFLPRTLCKELLFIQNSCAAVGYRPHVRATMLSHLIATNCGALIMPFVTIRETLRELVEAQFGCEFQLFVEFTGLISWTKGASIGWHSDDNKPYLKQRHFAAVCYLNDFEVDFQGGLFHFRQGQPATVTPNTGTVVIYSADQTNTHCVDEVLSGERCTLALWFTRDSAHDEDKKLIQQLSGQFQVFGLQGGIVEGGCWDSSFQWYPSPASSTMYWDGHGEPGKDRGFDIRCARLEVMGYNWRPAEAQEFVVHGSGEGKASTGCEVHQSWLENQPVIVQGADDGLPHTFRNISHALQVLEFGVWQSFCHGAPTTCSDCSTHPNVGNSTSQQECSMEQAERHWERYISDLWKAIHRLLPQWVACQSLFSPVVKPCVLPRPAARDALKSLWASSHLMENI